MPTEPWTPTDQLLDDIAYSLNILDDLGTSTWFDREERVLLQVDGDPEGVLEPPSPAAPSWRRELYAMARSIAEDTERYVRVPHQGPPAGRLRAFLDTLDDPALYDAVERAARGGRGAYRRAKEALHARGRAALWYDFETRQDRALALAWLRDEGLLAEE